ncbi:MAG: hypothetical protein NW207_02185 [Cytophagales bacterium]|nr:hypothetical protein [Cytophagales bacterium]
MHAQEADKPIIITGSRFVYPLIERWKEEFLKENPGVKFRLIPRGSSNVDSANFIINAHKLKLEEIKSGSYVINISRYAILPISNAKNPLVKEWNEKGIKTKQLKKIYFKKDEIDDEDAPLTVKRKTNEYQPKVYTRAQKACASITFATFYGFNQNEIIGKPIGGDDKHLITALENDTNGISYNNLNLIYDNVTRTSKKQLFVIPIDMNNNGRLDEAEKMYSNLDTLINRLERKTYDNIVTEYVNVMYSTYEITTNQNLQKFLMWILENGNMYVHPLGFLQLPAKDKQSNLELLRASFAK